MSQRQKAVALDLDPASLLSMHEGLPGWEIDILNGATTASLSRDWNPGKADLLVIRARQEINETLGLCRGVRSQAGRAHVPVLVLVPASNEALVKAVLEAGADSCLILPIHAKEIASVLDRVRRVNQPGRHTLNLDPAQSEDGWRDDGGQG